MFWQNSSEIGQSIVLFSSRRLKNFENEKLFLCLEIAEIDMGGQFWVEKNDCGHKNLNFKVKPTFQG